MGGRRLPARIRAVPEVLSSRWWKRCEARATPTASITTPYHVASFTPTPTPPSPAQRTKETTARLTPLTKALSTVGGPTVNGMLCKKHLGRSRHRTRSRSQRGRLAHARVAADACRLQVGVELRPLELPIVDGITRLAHGPSPGGVQRSVKVMCDSPSNPDLLNCRRHVPPD